MFRFCERKIRLESLKIIYFSIDSLIRFLLREEFHINVSKVKREKFRSFSDMIYRGITDHRLYIDQSISIGSFYTWPPRSNFRALSTRIFVPEARARPRSSRERRQRSRSFELRKPPAAHECRLASSRDHPVQRVEFVKIFRSSSTERFCVLARESIVRD